MTCHSSVCFGTNTFTFNLRISTCRSQSQNQDVLLGVEMHLRKQAAGQQICSVAPDRDAHQSKKNFNKILKKYFTI